MTERERETGQRALKLDGRDEEKSRENGGPKYESLLEESVPKNDLKRSLSCDMCMSESEVIVSV